MAYATKYLFKWESSNGTTREIRVQKDGYSGSVIQRRLGRAPVLKKQRNGTVFGTSLEFYAECAVDGEFAEFYTSDPKAYKVLLYTGATLLWQGYVTPELYSEPDIAPPYDVQVIATDGIGELKLYDFAAQGVKTLRQMFTYLLGYTGLGTDVYLISSMKAGSSGAGALLDKTINLDYKVGDTCYEVLTYLLDTLHATITWWRGAWIVARETNVTFSSNKVRYYNTSGNSALLTGSVVTLGKMYTNDAWPVGQLTQKIDPAKKSVTIQAPWHVNDAFVNGPMDTDTGWTKTNNASWNSTKKGYNLPDNGQTTDLATVSQSISMLGMRVPMDFVGKFCASLISGQMYNGVAGVAVDYVTSGNVTYHLGKDSEGNPTWVSGSSGNTDYDFQLRLTAVDTDDANAEALSFTIPALAVGTSYPAGTLTVRIVGRSAIVFSASLDVVITKGYQDRLHIDNGARGEEGTVEIAIGRETSDIDYYKAFMQGLLLDSGSLITSFKDDNLTTATDFLSYISRDYARSFALPRIVRTGKVYLEDGVSYPPLVLSKGAVDYWLETFSWDMYEDELDISARSLPTATITVESEVIAEYGTGTASSSSSSGGGATPITPIPSVLPNPYALTFGNKSYDGSEPVTLTASDIGALTGITAAMVNAAYGFTISGTAGSTYNLGNLHTHSNKSLLDSMTINWDDYFGIDNDGNVYVKKNGDNPRNFYSYGAVSAGGLSTGGGTGGIDLAAMWASLQNNDNETSYYTKKIHTDHFPTISGTGITGTYASTWDSQHTTLSTSLTLDISGALNDYLPLSAGSTKPLTGPLYFGANQQILKGAYSVLPYINTNVSNLSIREGLGLFTTNSSTNDCGGLIISDSTAVLYNAFDAGWGFQIHDEDLRGAENLFDDTTRIFGIDSSYYAVVRSGYKVINGTSSQFLKADGSKDSTTYLPTSGGSVGYLNVPTAYLSITNSGSDTVDQWINFYDASGKNAALGIRRGIATYGPTYWYSEGGSDYFYRLYHEGNLSTATLVGSSAIGSSTQPVYYTGSTFSACDLSTTYAPYYADGYAKLRTYNDLTFASDEFTFAQAAHSGALWFNARTASGAFDGAISYYRMGDGRAGYAGVMASGYYLASNADNSYVLTAGGGSAAISGLSVSSAATLTTSRSIWGQSFNGSADVTGAQSNVTNIDSLLYFDTTNSRIGIRNGSPGYTLDVVGNVYSSSEFVTSGGLSSYAGEFLRVYAPGYGTYNKAVFTITSNHVEFEFPNATDEYSGTHFPVYFGWRGGIYPLQLLSSGVVNINAGNSTGAVIGTITFKGGNEIACLSGDKKIWLNYDSSGDISMCNGGGGVVIGGLSVASGTKLYVVGNAVATGAVTAGSASDSRLKENIKTISHDSARDFIMKLRPVTFKWNALATSLYDKYEGADLGFVAQEVEPLMPMAISTIFNDYKRLDQVKFIAPLVSTSQYLLTTTDNHETRIQQLENRVKELEDENGKLKARLTN